MTSDAPAANLAIAADRAGIFGRFLSAVDKAGLGNLLTAEGQTTLFAPTDTSFTLFPDKTWADFERTQPALLRSILNCHFTKGRLTGADLLGARTNAMSFQGAPFVVEGDGPQPRILGAALTHMDINADNGVIHGIDNMLWFAEAPSRPRREQSARRQR